MTDQHTGGPGDRTTGGDHVATDAQTKEASDHVQPPSLASRFGALMIDWLLCLLVSYLFADPGSAAWLAPLVLIIEYGFFLGLFGQTPGMRLAKLRCVSMSDGRPIGVIRATLRGLLLCLVVPALIMDDDRRGLHDRAAGSIVMPA